MFLLNMVVSAVGILVLFSVLVVIIVSLLQSKQHKFSYMILIMAVFFIVLIVRDTIHFL
ncbi:hypothetical protein P4637_17740 [Halalkalibacterium halodurans]|uniref:hypothetical protein n=1 Tax=Halalkalibacterium halodurans TaxID=86665 RepID=UPI001293A68E|nr:hypothetical protein [Halalkalibacterium halodurans]MDY7221134.1 hypothetical protein [Halalkalibacterium halodurans]MDY7240373.1 hypothetical protein [Halalkalibacterium halodurans]MED4082731.1 hypothetical protein [Halalkalibacterium halodurans]MED4086657.1 hypothetical protein [Halalkalibacterium halodurans]MED4103233.1 hypothetical protein [Halalkalibacterium halodurans]